MQDGNYRRARAAQIAALLYDPMDPAEGPYPEFEDGTPDAGPIPITPPMLNEIDRMGSALRPLMPSRDDAIQPVPEEPDEVSDRRQALARQLLRRG